jgi:hypothetical protein
VSAVTKILFFIGVLLFAVKVLSGGRLRELGRRLDGAINLIIFLLLITYAGYALYWLVTD